MMATMSIHNADDTLLGPLNDSFKFFIANLASHMTAPDIKAFFSSFGVVNFVKLIYETNNKGGEKKSKGYGFVYMYDAAGDAAVQNYLDYHQNRIELLGQSRVFMNRHDSAREMPLRHKHSRDVAVASVPAGPNHFGQQLYSSSQGSYPQPMPPLEYATPYSQISPGYYPSYPQQQPNGTPQQGYPQSNHQQGYSQSSHQQGYPQSSHQQPYFDQPPTQYGGGYNNHNNNGFPETYQPTNQYSQNQSWAMNHIGHFQGGGNDPSYSLPHHHHHPSNDPYIREPPNNMNHYPHTNQVHQDHNYNRISQPPSYSNKQPVQNKDNENYETQRPARPYNDATTKVFLENLPEDVTPKTVTECLKAHHLIAKRCTMEYNAQDNTSSARVELNSPQDASKCCMLAKNKELNCGGRTLKASLDRPPRPNHNKSRGGGRNHGPRREGRRDRPY